MAPRLEDPRVEFDGEKNEINIKLEGKVGPLVEVTFPNYNLKESKQQKLLPIKREGNLDYSVLDEGARRVRNDLQEQGYFFAEVTPRMHSDTAHAEHDAITEPKRPART